MIRPDVEMVDFDPDGTARVHEVYARARAAEAWVYVLHQAGRVVRVFAQPAVPNPERLPTLGEGIEDPDDLARRIRRATQATRAVVIDHELLGDLVGAAAAQANPRSTLPSFRSAVARTFWTHPAVATDPAPARDRLGDLHTTFVARGPRVTALVSLTDAAGLVLAALVVFEHGLITSMRGIVADDPVEEGRRQAGGRLDITLQVEWDAFVAAVLAPDQLSAYARLIEQSQSTGLEDVRDIIRGSA